MPKYCVYCGKPVAPNDKFCISCGKPLLANLPKTEKKTEKAVPEKSKEKNLDKKKKKKDKKEKEVETELEEEMELGEELEEVEKKLKDKKQKKKEVNPLSEDVKEQIEIHLELNEIREKKKNLAEKLKEIQKLVKSPQYDTDFEFGEKINVQLKAVKTLIGELKQKENELKQKATDKFIVEKLNTDIAVKRDQLKNLWREHKLKKIRDKDVVRKLKEKYKQQLENFISEKEELIAGINLWIEDLIDRKSELTTEKNFNKARFSSKEISEKEFKEKDSEFVKQIDKVENKIKTLKTLIK
ncbi:MAG: zinc-ribbon domain-containing protein [Promethearchaeota archaeon]|nr:MAG: zinc-ribbon domain-containing protein [Candidatus Lokiarchaeota archaeon]